MAHCNNYIKIQSRREFLAKSAMGFGTLGLASLMNPTTLLANKNAFNFTLPSLPHFAPKAKRVIYLHQSGAPSQMDLFDYKLLLNKMYGEELPASIRQGQRLTGMTAGQTSFPLAGSHIQHLNKSVIPKNLNRSNKAMMLLIRNYAKNANLVLSKADMSFEY